MDFIPIFANTDNNRGGNRDYYAVCKYKTINNGDYLYTILPFNISKASTRGEIYIIPGELTF
jgi:hypothetical protein